MVLYITFWYGRYGNNVQQLLNTIWYAVHFKHRRIVLPKAHWSFKTTEIMLEEFDNNPECIRDFFFYSKKLPGCSPEHYPTIEDRRQLAQKYLLQYLTYNPNQCDVVVSNDVCFHIRGGDTCIGNGHKEYLPPPLSYYQEISKCYNSFHLVYEDTRNPCVPILLKHCKTAQSKTVIDDIQRLCSFKSVGTGPGTFGNLIYYFSTNLITLWVPDYNNLDESDHIRVVSITDYIQLHTWVPTRENMQKVISSGISTIKSSF